MGVCSLSDVTTLVNINRSRRAWHALLLFLFSLLSPHEGEVRRGLLPHITPKAIVSFGITPDVAILIARVCAVVVVS